MPFLSLVVVCNIIKSTAKIIRTTLAHPCCDVNMGSVSQLTIMKYSTLYSCICILDNGGKILKQGTMSFHNPVSIQAVELKKLLDSNYYECGALFCLHLVLAEPYQVFSQFSSFLLSTYPGADRSIIPQYVIVTNAEISFFGIFTRCTSFQIFEVHLLPPRFYHLGHTLGHSLINMLMALMISASDGRLHDG